MTKYFRSIHSMNERIVERKTNLKIEKRHNLLSNRDKCQNALSEIWNEVGDPSNEF